jgi:hypothetical protein
LDGGRKLHSADISRFNATLQQHFNTATVRPNQKSVQRDLPLNNHQLLPPVQVRMSCVSVDPGQVEPVSCPVPQAAIVKTPLLRLVEVDGRALKRVLGQRLCLPQAKRFYRITGIRHPVASCTMP